MLPNMIPVSYHKDYKNNSFVWKRTRDCVAGEARVKSKNTFYLPMPSAMLELPPAASTQAFRDYEDYGYGQMIENPNFHNNPAYAAYLARAEFPEITQFILRGLLGLVGADSPTITLPERLSYLKDSCTLSGMSLEDFYLFAISEVMITGRFPVLLDINAETGKPVFVPFVAEALEDWKTTGGMSSNKTGVSAAIFRDFEFTDADIFGADPKVIRKLAIVEGGVYTVATYKDDGLQGSVTPSFQGTPLKYIPMVCMGSITNSLQVDPSPLSPIAASAIQIYMKNADLSNAEFLTCNPTLVITGIEATATPTAIGSSVCWILPDPDSTANYTKTDTSALDHVLNHINTIYEHAIYQGAQLLDSSKKASESAETTRLKQAASGATLLAVVLNVREGIKKLLDMAAEWTNSDKEAISFMPLTEFMSPTLSAPEHKALVESWVAGAISHETLLENFRKAGLLKTGDTIDEEIDRVAKESEEKEAKFLAQQTKLKEASNEPTDKGNQSGNPPKVTDGEPPKDE